MSFRAIRDLVLTLTVTFMLTQSGRSADITIMPQNDYGCIVQLDGIIEKGDVDKLVKLTSSHDNYSPGVQYFPGEGIASQNTWSGEDHLLHSICLSSPGGLISEALRLVRYMGGALGTVVPAGSTCESACALVFMAGSALTGAEDYTQVNRRLHAGAKLGFHAPSLNIPDGNYSEEAVARAYSFAVNNIALIQEEQDLLNIPSSLLIHMLKTPTSDMFYIDTVGKAIRWNIPLLGTKPPLEFTGTEMVRACFAGVEILQDTYRQYGEVNGYGFGDSPDYLYSSRGEKVTAQNNNKYRGRSYGYLDEGASDCHFYYDANGLDGGTGSVKFDYIESPIEIKSHFLLHPDTFLKDIALTEDSR